MESFGQLRQSEDALQHFLSQASISPETRERVLCLLHAIDCGNVSQACERYGIARQTFYTWVQRFHPNDPHCLEKKPSIPKKKRHREIDPVMVTIILDARRALRSRDEIFDLLSGAVSPATITRVCQDAKLPFANRRAEQRESEQPIVQTIADIRYGTMQSLQARLEKIDSASCSSDGIIVACVGLIATGLLLGGGFMSPPVAHAAQGSVYQLDASFDSNSNENDLQGSSYTLNGGTTDVGNIAQGSQYQVVPASTNSSASPSTTSSSDTSEQVSSTARSGGRRPHPIQTTSSSAQASSQERTGEEQQQEVTVMHAMEHAAGPSQSGETLGAVSSASMRYRTDDIFTGLGGSDVSESASMTGVVGSGSSVFLSLPTVTIRASVMSALQWFTHILLFFLGICIGYSLGRYRKERGAPRRRQNDHARKLRKGMQRVLSVLIVLALFVPIMPITHAAATVPLTHSYHGRLLDLSGNAVTTAHTIRFSYWKSADFTSTDLTATGAIHTGAASYVGWFEEQEVTPNSSGYFSIALGSSRTLPSMDSLPASTLQSLYLQVEVKVSGAADSTYDLLDTNSSSTTDDRAPVLSVPFAMNADMLDQRDIGTGSGSIPVLQTGGALSKSVIPGGTNSGSFLIDADGSEASAVKLQFGSSLARQLSFDVTNNWFNFSGDVRVQGNLTATASVSGAILHAQNALRSSGSLVVEGASNFEGSLTFGDAISDAMTVNASAWTFTNDTTFIMNGASQMLEIVGTASGRVFHAQDQLRSSGSLVVRGATTLQSTLRLNNVTYTFPGGDGSASGRILMTNGAGQLSWSLAGTGSLQTRMRTLTMPINTAAITTDGTSNDVNVYVGSETGSTANPHQYERIASGSGQVQDVDLRLKILLPADFVSFANTGDLQFSYKNTGSSSTQSKLDILVKDKDSDDAFTAADGQTLFNTSWTQFTHEFDGGSFNPAAGQYVYVTIKGYASGSGSAYAGEVILTYTSR